MELKYGRGLLQLPVQPDGAPEVLVPESPGGPVALPESIAQAADALRRRIEGRTPAKVAIITEDRTRRNPELPALLEALISAILATCPDAHLDLIPGYGTHPPHTESAGAPVAYLRIACT